MRDLDAKVQRAVLRNALRRAAAVVKKRAANNLRAQGAASLARDVGTSASVQPPKAEAKIGARKRTRLGRLGHLLENGTRPHRIVAGARGKKLTGKRVLADRASGAFFGVAVTVSARPHPWLRPAHEGATQKVLAEFERHLVNEVNKAAVKGSTNT